MFLGESIFLDYTPLLEVTIEAAYSKQLRISDHVGIWPPDTLKLPLFYPGSPLIRRFSLYHYGIEESGLSHHLEKMIRYCL